jgi:Fe-S cluster assembly iron-binding protein IscA
LVGKEAKFMVQVTEAARRHLRALRTATRLTRPDTAPRIAAGAPGRLGVFRGVRKPEDIVIYHEGAPVLLLDPRIASTLDHAVIHCRRGQGGSQLVITPPRASLDPTTS